MNLLDHITIHTGDALKVLRKMPAESVHCVVTSPPYWGLRDYGVAGQYGLEPDPNTYLKRMVRVFREVRRVLRKDGTCWVNMGDSYAGNRGPADYNAKSTLRGTKQGSACDASRMAKVSSRKRDDAPVPRSDYRVRGLKPKDMVGMPWRLALAMQADGWYLRRDIIWAKRNPMPETVKDRCSTAHEYFFHFTKSTNYWYDADAIAEPTSDLSNARGNGVNPKARQAFPTGWGKGDEPRDPIQLNTAGIRTKANRSFSEAVRGLVDVRNKRSVWHLQTEPYPGAHFATFGPTWIEPAILAGCPSGGTVLDPFGGSGTTAGVAVAHGRKAVLIELNPAYVSLIPERVEHVVRHLRNAPAPKAQPQNQQTLFQ